MIATTNAYFLFNFPFSIIWINTAFRQSPLKLFQLVFSTFLTKKKKDNEKKKLRHNCNLDSQSVRRFVGFLEQEHEFKPSLRRITCSRYVVVKTKERILENS
jgi:hypothetical protein